MEKNLEYYNSPVGVLKIQAEGQYITNITIEEEIGQDNKNNKTSECRKQLEEYFDGKRQKFDIEIKFNEGTEFQKKVWNELKKIQYGETLSYKNIAERIGNEKAVRAVGGANNRNPIMIVVPCHRVIGKNGKMVGYAGGIEKKELLLNLERNEL